MDIRAYNCVCGNHNRRIIYSFSYFEGFRIRFCLNCRVIEKLSFDTLRQGAHDRLEGMRTNLHPKPPHYVNSSPGKQISVRELSCKTKKATNIHINISARACIVVGLLHTAVGGLSRIVILQHQQFPSESTDAIDHRLSTPGGKPSLRCSLSVLQPQHPVPQHHRHYLPPLTEGVFDFLQTTFVPGCKA